MTNKAICFTLPAVTLLLLSSISMVACLLLARPAAALAIGDTVTASIVKPQAGDNNLKITVKSPAGKPVTGAKITTSVAMTNMDMGTTNPPVKDVGHGVYTSKVNFSMSGPWAITLRITPAGGKPFTRVFDFNAN